MRRFEYRFQFGIRKYWNHRCCHHPHRYSGVTHSPDRFDPPTGSAGPRFQSARQVVIQRGNADVHLHQILRRHRHEQIQVAFDARRLGNDRDRMFASRQDLQHRARYPIALFHWLIRISIGAERDRARFVLRLAQFLSQQRRGFRFGEQLGFEIDAGGQTDVGVRRARIAVDTTVLTATIWIDRLIERNIRGFVATYDGARRVNRDSGSSGAHRFIQRTPAVVFGFTRARLEPAVGIGGCAAPLTHCS